MLLWCGLDGQVVSKPVADGVLASHKDLLRTLGLCKAVATWSRGLANPAAAGPGVAAVLVDHLSRHMPSASCRQRRQECAGLSTAALPSGWHAVVGGLDLLGLQEDGDAVDVALFLPGGGGEGEEAGLSLLAASLERMLQVRALVGEGGVILTSAAPSSSSPPPPAEASLTLPEGTAPHAAQQLSSAGVTCTATNASTLTFPNHATAGYAIGLGAAGPAPAFTAVPPSVAGQTVCLAPADSRLGLGVSYRAALLFDAYLGKDPAFRLAARGVLRWVRGSGLAGAMPVEGWLVVFCCSLVASGAAAFVPPGTVGPLPQERRGAEEGGSVDGGRVASTLLGFFKLVRDTDWATKAAALHAPGYPLIDRSFHPELQQTSRTRKSLLRAVEQHVHLEMCVVHPFTGANLGVAVSKVALLHVVGAAAVGFDAVRRCGAVPGPSLGRFEACAAAGCCGEGERLPPPEEVRPSEVLVPLSDDVPGPDPAPVSPSYAATGNQPVLQRKQPGESVAEVLRRHSLWNSSDGGDEAPSEPSSSPVALSPPAGGAKRTDGQIVDALVGVFLANDEQQQQQQLANDSFSSPHISLYARGAVSTPVGASPLPPLMSPGPASPATFFNRSFSSVPKDT